VSAQVVKLDGSTKDLLVESRARFIHLTERWGTEARGAAGLRHLVHLTPTDARRLAVALLQAAGEMGR
jgi:hypothetical protein